MTERTPNTWPEGTIPTAAQLLPWVRAAQDDEVLVMLASMLDDYQQARRCVMAEHDAGMAELNRLRVDATRWAILVDTERTPTHDTIRVLGETAARLIEESQAP